jgi:hypothetical protein
MGLNLCIFTEDQEDEIGSCDIGHYSDFGCFRDTIARHLRASDFPVLMTHSDCDGEWTLEEMPALIRELETIAAKFRTLPPEEPKEAFEHTAECRRGAKSLYDCFHDVNDQNLFRGTDFVMQARHQFTAADFVSMSRQPYKSPEPTAVGTVSSAVAVHVTSRWWLSFFRSTAYA